MQQASQQNSEKPKTTCHHAKSQVTIGVSAVNTDEKKIKPEITRIVPTIPATTMKVVKQTLTPTVNFRTISTQTKQIIKETEDLDLSTHLVTHVVELITPQRNVTLERTQRADHFPAIDDRKDKANLNREMLKATHMGIFRLPPKL